MFMFCIQVTELHKAWHSVGGSSKDHAVKESGPSLIKDELANDSARTVPQQVDGDPWSLPPDDVSKCSHHGDRGRNPPRTQFPELAVIPFPLLEARSAVASVLIRPHFETLFHEPGDQSVIAQSVLSQTVDELNNSPRFPSR
jgi:hypothetical protein